MIIEKLINDAKKLLTDSKNYSIEEIAQLLMISNSGLRRKFKEWEGVSLIEFRLQKKLEEAKLLLSSTDLPLKEIAQICNFYDTAYFYKIFHKIFISKYFSLIIIPIKYIYI